MQKQNKNTVQRMDEFIGCKGEVITTIPTEGFGEIYPLNLEVMQFQLKQLGKRYFTGTEVIVRVQDGVLLVQNIAYS